MEDPNFPYSVSFVKHPQPLEEICVWCVNTFPRQDFRFLSFSATVCFRKQEDAVLFALRWS